MLASKNEYLNEASNTIFQLNSDEQIQKQCRDREEYYQDMHNYDRAISNYEKVISDYENTIEDYENSIHEKDNLIQKLYAEIEQLKNNQNLR